MNQTVPYLAGTSNEQLNFEAGENVLLKLEPTDRFSSFLVTGPDPKDQAAAAPFAQQRIPGDRRAARTSASGRSRRRRSTIARTLMGFSVNAPRGREPVRAAREARS